MKFHERLKYLRKFNNMTQEDLSLKMKVSPAAIGLYEQGRRNPDNDTLIKLASIFEVSIDYLLGLEGATIPNNTTLLYNGDDELKIEIANLTKQILESTDNTDTLVMLRDMLSGVCKK
jgi:transcriptional regulator with XRE-family HTH domain